jgi:response regulator RpfG family c-di-GMP phosphodiesterase
MSTHLLVVDDEEMIREMLASSFSDEGFTCHDAGNAEEACVILSAMPIDLALVDIMMPGRSGVQLLNEIKNVSPDTAVLMVTALDNLETALACLRMGADDYITKPFNIDRIVRDVHNTLEKRRLILENRAYQSELEHRVEEQTVQIRLNLEDIRKAYEYTLTSLVRALDAREREVGAHSERVSAYALQLGKALGIDETLLSSVGKGALLHDIGKIGISDGILLKPGKLTSEEWEEMKRHPQLGYDIIAGVETLEEAAEVVLTHQERYDGTGYPKGLKGERIPLGSRIFALIDTLDAMTSDRPYRKALPFTAVVEEVKRCTGSQFDPLIARVFLSIPRQRWEELRGRAFD